MQFSMFISRSSHWLSEVVQDPSSLGILLASIVVAALLWAWVMGWLTGK